MTGVGRSHVFSDGKAPDALRTIGEVGKALGIRQHVLRYWEEQFPALKPVKRSGGRRFYRPEDVQLIVTIDRLVHREGYTLKGARRAISKNEVPAEEIAEPQALAMSLEVAAELKGIRDRLASALAEA